MFTTIEILNCSSCPLLKEIPLIKGLRTLDCFHCPLLKEIPQIKGLQVLDCYNCPLLKEIPQIEGLQYLDCSNCPLLINIPQQTIEGLHTFNYSGCKWLECNDTMIKKVKMLQRWFKRVLLSKRLTKIIPQLMPLYYNPEAKGGYIHKRDMLLCIENIHNE